VSALVNLLRKLARLGPTIELLARQRTGLATFAVHGRVGPFLRMRVISVGYTANSAGVASWVCAMAGALATLSGCGSRTGFDPLVFDPLVEESRSDAALVAQDATPSTHTAQDAASLDAFNAAESMWTSVGCATVDCAVAVYHCSQQGVVCTAGTTVACVGGRCRTECLP
jgi:hypothetical protein